MDYGCWHSGFNRVYGFYKNEFWRDVKFCNRSRVYSGMKIFSLFLLLAFTSFKPGVDDGCLTSEERQLFNQINEYRQSKGLKAIPLSPSLTFVAKAHANDLFINEPTNARCNMHSWSSKGKWKSCCYTSDHKQAACMWDKPRELTKYTGDGFEIAAMLGETATAKAALDGWKSSQGHNMVIVNKGVWAKMDWQAMGIGMAGGYAVVWFGIEPDKQEKCISN